MSYLTSLPFHVLLEIFKYLPPDALLNTMPLVCKKFEETVRSNSLFKVYAEQPPYYYGLANVHLLHPMYNRNVKILVIDVQWKPTRELRLPSLEEIHFKVGCHVDHEFYPDVFPNLKRAYFHCINTGIRVSQVLKIVETFPLAKELLVTLNSDSDISYLFNDVLPILKNSESTRVKSNIKWLKFNCTVYFTYQPDRRIAEMLSLLNDLKRRCLEQRDELGNFFFERLTCDLSSISRSFDSAAVTQFLRYCNKIFFRESLNIDLSVLAQRSQLLEELIVEDTSIVKQFAKQNSGLDKVRKIDIRIKCAHCSTHHLQSDLINHAFFNKLLNDVLHSLETLIFYDNYLEGVNLSKTCLRKVYLSYCGLEEVFLDDLLKTPQLEELTINNCYISDSDLSKASVCSNGRNNLFGRPRPQQHAARWMSMRTILGWRSFHKGDATYQRPTSIKKLNIDIVKLLEYLVLNFNLNRLESLEVDISTIDEGGLEVVNKVLPIVSSANLESIKVYLSSKHSDQHQPVYDVLFGLIAKFPVVCLTYPEKADMSSVEKCMWKVLESFGNNPDCQIESLAIDWGYVTLKRPNDVLVKLRRLPRLRLFGSRQFCSNKDLERRMYTNESAFQYASIEVPCKTFHNWSVRAFVIFRKELKGEPRHSDFDEQELTSWQESALRSKELRRVERLRRQAHEERFPEHFHHPFPHDDDGSDDEW